MAHWLMKSEPSSYSWQQLEKDGRTNWSGVRNFQASNNLKAMKLDDRAFFYHSNEGLAVVGIMTIAKEYYPDPTDESGRFGMVDVAPLRPVVAPDGRHFQCSTHGARFRIADGYCVAGPCQGERLAAVAVTVEDGVVRLA